MPFRDSLFVPTSMLKIPRLLLVLFMLCLMSACGKDSSPAPASNDHATTLKWPACTRLVTRPWGYTDTGFTINWPRLEGASEYDVFRCEGDAATCGDISSGKYSSELTIPNVGAVTTQENYYSNFLVPGSVNPLTDETFVIQAIGPTGTDYSPPTTITLNKGEGIEDITLDSPSQHFITAGSGIWVRFDLQGIPEGTPLYFSVNGGSQDADAYIGTNPIYLFNYLYFWPKQCVTPSCMAQATSSAAIDEIGIEVTDNTQYLYLGVWNNGCEDAVVQYAVHTVAQSNTPILATQSVLDTWADGKSRADTFEPDDSIAVTGNRSPLQAGGGTEEHTQHVANNSDYIPMQKNQAGSIRVMLNDYSDVQPRLNEIIGGNTGVVEDFRSFIDFVPGIGNQFVYKAYLDKADRYYLHLVGSLGRGRYDINVNEISDTPVYVGVYPCTPAGNTSYVNVSIYRRTESDWLLLQDGNATLAGSNLQQWRIRLEPGHYLARIYHPTRYCGAHGCGDNISIYLGDAGCYAFIADNSDLPLVSSGNRTDDSNDDFSDMSDPYQAIFGQESLHYIQVDAAQDFIEFVVP